jgi:hypothetical protein
VLGKKLPVKVVGKQDGGNPTGEVIGFLIGRNNAMHRIVRRDKESGVQMRLDQNGQVGQGIFPGKFPGKEEGQGKRPGKDNSPTNQKTFWIYGTYTRRSLHEGVIRRLKYAPEPAP